MSNAIESPKSSTTSQQGSPYNRSRPQPSQSATELTPPPKASSGSHHRTGLHHRRERDDPQLSPTVHPGTLQQGRAGRASLEGARSEEVMPSTSPDSSMRASTMGLFASGDDSIQPVAPMLANGQARKVSNEEKIRREKEKTAKTVSSLKKSLLDLGEFSTEASRRLDETYYSVLEKMSVLQTSIIGLKELAQRSRKIPDDFQRDTESLASDIRAQVDSFNRFEQQRTRIDLLQDRIEKGRAKIATLTERVDVVRGRVEGWERADKDWQERTRKRLKVVWTIMSVIFFAMLLLFVSAQYADPEELAEAGFNVPNIPEVNLTAAVEKVIGLLPSKTEVVETSPAKLERPSPIRESTSPAKSHEHSLAVESRPSQSLSLRSRRSEGADDRLRALDEL